MTRLARVCSSDAGFHSYTEVTIQCSSQGVDYNLLQDAVVLKVGDNLADELRLERGSDILIGVFVASKDHTNSNAGLTSSSAICMFPLADIEQKFAENIHLCYNGSVSSRNMDYIAGGVNECPEAGVSGSAATASCAFCSCILERGASARASGKCEVRPECSSCSVVCESVPWRWARQSGPGLNHNWPRIHVGLKKTSRKTLSRTARGESEAGVLCGPPSWPGHHDAHSSPRPPVLQLGALMPGEDAKTEHRRRSEPERHSL